MTPPTTNADFALDDLLLRWEEERRRGRDLTPEELCRDRTDLLPEVRSQVAALRAMDRLLDGPSEAPAARPGAVVSAPGRYRVVRPHARGGIGEVLLARDEGLNRDVALKRLLGTRGADPRPRRRFLREAEITGRLQHPGVVPVYGLGADAAGEPCYAMRFVEGETLHDAARRYHDDAGRASAEGRLAFRQLLGRFVAVCQAVAYAHSQGVVHRDLKPANVMLGRFGETLVVDWGLARASAADEVDPASETVAPDAAVDADVGATRTGDLLGTPAYMSPEQAEGAWERVGPASDVYSLGATLYVLLTGLTPFAGGVGDFLARVRRGAFAPPRQARAGVPAPLDAVCRKAMALRPEDRYASALDLAADVERWLADEPVSVFRDPLSVRLPRLLRRHKAKAAAAAVLLAAGVVGLAVGAALLNRERRQTADALVEARANLRLAREAIDQYSTRVAKERLLNQPGAEDLRKALLEDAVAFYERFARQPSADAATRVEMALAHGRLARLVSAVDSSKKAAEMLREAVARLEPLARDRPDDAEVQDALGQCLGDLAAQQMHQFALDDTEKTLLQAREHAERRHEADPSRREPRVLLARTFQILATWHAARKQFGPALAACERSLALRKELSAEGTDPESRRGLAAAYRQAGTLYRIGGRAEDSRAAYGRAREVVLGLAAESPEDRGYQNELADATFYLAQAQNEAGRPDEAAEMYRQAAETYERLARDFPRNLQHPSSLANTWNELAEIPAAAGRGRDAEDAWQKTVTLLEPLARDRADRPMLRVPLAAAYWHLGRAALDRGEAAASLDWNNRLLGIADSAVSRENDNFHLQSAHLGRALALGRLNRPAEELAAWDALVPLYPEGASRDHFRSQRALCLVAVGKADRALVEVEELLSRPAPESRVLAQAARVFASASAAAASDASLTSGRRKEAAESRAARAVAVLRRAVAAGQFAGAKGRAEMAADPALKPLRGRADFEELLKPAPPRSEGTRDPQ